MSSLVLLGEDFSFEALVSTPVGLLDPRTLGPSDPRTEGKSVKLTPMPSSLFLRSTVSAGWADCAATVGARRD